MLYGVSYSTPLHPNQYGYNHIELMYNKALSAMHDTLYQAALDKQDWDSCVLAACLMNQAMSHDIRQTYKLIEKPYVGSIQRNLDCPPDYNHPSLVGQIWADDADHPLEIGETWNAGRRETNTHVPYPYNENGLPLNHYLNYGINGRGVIGRFGPNHAVDDGVLRIMPNKDGKPTLHALGIVRKDNGLSALCGGFTEFSIDSDGEYRYLHSDMIHTQAKEFVEELVSGSIELMPEYAKGLDEDIQHALSRRATAQGKPLSEKQTAAITDEIITHRKIIQIETEDPQFIKNIEDAFSNAYPCYAGPVLNSDRNTNNAWMETRLSWIMLDEPTWDKIKGDNKFNYQLAAGDDAESVLWYEITPELMTKANGSHDAFFAYLLSGYLLTQKHEDKRILQAVQEQAQDLITYFRSSCIDPAVPACAL